MLKSSNGGKVNHILGLEYSKTTHSGNTTI